MRRCIFLSALLLCGCAGTPRLAPREPSALLAPGRRVTFDDADLRAELAVDAARTLIVELFNKSDALVDVDWSELTAIGPDHVAALPLRSATLAALPPGARVSVHVAWKLSPGASELVLPTVVRGTAREYHYHLVCAPKPDARHARR